MKKHVFEKATTYFHVVVSISNISNNRVFKAAFQHVECTFGEAESDVFQFDIRMA